MKMEKFRDLGGNVRLAPEDLYGRNSVKGVPEKSSYGAGDPA
jgi:hypothetical protein